MHNGAYICTALAGAVMIGFGDREWYISIWLIENTGWPFDTKFFMTTVSIIIDWAALMIGIGMPDRIDRFIYDYEGDKKRWNNQKRRWTHSWVIAFPLLAASLLYFGPRLPSFFFIGYAAHCLVDAFTVTGAPIFNPTKRISLAAIPEAPKIATRAGEVQPQSTYLERRFFGITAGVFILALLFRYQTGIYWTLK